jgi:hypothetical protein
LTPTHPEHRQECLCSLIRRRATPSPEESDLLFLTPDNFFRLPRSKRKFLEEFFSELKSFLDVAALLILSCEIESGKLNFHAMRIPVRRIPIIRGAIR